jgi:hypothetical protein
MPFAERAEDDEGRRSHESEKEITPTHATEMTSLRCG